MNRELIIANSSMHDAPDPKLYSVGETVFARRATRSDAGRGQVDKLIYPFTGPWLITAKLDGASYEIEHVATKRKDKKHASDLSPYPAELTAFQPLDGADNQYGQIHQKISDHPYKEAGIKGITPPTPFGYQPTLSRRPTLLNFDGLLWPSSMKSYIPILGPRTKNSINICPRTATPYVSCQGSTQARHPPLCSTLLRRSLQQPSSLSKL